MKRCGSPATTGAPVVVRAPVRSQPLEPEVPGPSVAKRVARSSPSLRATSSRQSLVGNPAKRTWVESQTPSGVQGSQRPGASPAAANSGAWAAPSARPSLTPSTYAPTQAAVSGARRSKQLRAVSASRARRANRSQSTASAPRYAAVVPSTRWRSVSSCQARSRAALWPCARARPRALPALRWGIPRSSRKTSKPPVAPVSGLSLFGLSLSMSAVIVLPSPASGGFQPLPSPRNLG